MIVIISHKPLTVLYLGCRHEFFMHSWKKKNTVLIVPDLELFSREFADLDPKWKCASHKFTGWQFNYFTVPDLWT